MLNCCNESTGVFFTDARINYDKDVELLFICFNQYKRIRSCYFNKQIFPEHGKICPLCMNLEIFRKEMLQHGKVLS